MLEQIHPKLPMRNKEITQNFYVHKLGFTVFGAADYPEYLMVERDSIQIHFFAFPDLNSSTNYGQIYIRCNAIESLYEELISKNVAIHPNGKLERKSWNQLEFSILDPDFNLLTLAQNLSLNQ